MNWHTFRNSFECKWKDIKLQCQSWWRPSYQHPYCLVLPVVTLEFFSSLSSHQSLFHVYQPLHHFCSILSHLVRIMEHQPFWLFHLQPRMLCYPCRSEANHSVIFTSVEQVAASKRCIYRWRWIPTNKRQKDGDGQAEETERKLRKSRMTESGALPIWIWTYPHQNWEHVE